MNRKSYFILPILLLSACLGYSQGMFSITYDVSLPVGATNAYIGQASFRGVTLIDGRAFISNNISIGGSLGWHVFVEKLSGTFSPEPNLDVTGTQVRYINSFPIMARGHYYWNTYGRIMPYVGFGAGTINVNQRTDFGLFTDRTNSWTFGLSPQVGAIFDLAGQANIHLKAEYNHGFRSGDTNFDIQYFTIGLGFAWF